MIFSRIPGVYSIGEVVEGMFHFKEIERVKKLFRSYEEDVKKFSEGLLDEPFDVEIDKSGVEYETLRWYVCELYWDAIEDIEKRGSCPIESTRDISKLVNDGSLPEKISEKLDLLYEDKL